MAQLRRARSVAVVLALAAALAPRGIAGQTPRAPLDSPARSVAVVAGSHYAAGWFHRLMLGAHYRDL
jgi:hypothetical protein